MRTAAETRRENLRYLVDTRFAGVNNRLAEYIGVDSMQISRVFHKKSSRRNVGDKLARQIEEKLELERGWLDADHAKVDDLMQMIAGLDAEGREAVKIMINALVRRQQQSI